jgi:hypothetical protein
MKYLAGMLSVILSLTTPPAVATLGEQASTVTQDAGKMKGVQKATLNQGLYATHEMVSGVTTIREFSNRDGLVFAVSWRGLAKPDLNILFGSYYAEYEAGAAKLPRQRGRRSVSLETSKMVLRGSSRMRDQRGFAYIPSLVPPGIKLEDLEQ